MHGANYLRPPPDLVDNEEEYEVEKILDSRQFGRRKQLQYLVKWKGYPNSDNMWVDKDDVFAEDKVRELKSSNPDARTHIKCLWKDGIPQFSLAPSSSSSSSYFTPHILPMSDNGSDTAYEPRLSTLESPPIEAELQPPQSSGVSNAAEIAAAFSRMSIGPPPIPTTESDEPQGLVTLQVPQHAVSWHADSSSMATRTAVTHEDPTGRAEQGPSRTRHDSDQSDYEPDLRLCPRGCGPMEYCHGHDSPAPTPIPAPRTPLPVRPPAGRLQGMASFRLNREDATALATQLLRAFGEDHENAAEVPPAYPAREVTAQGMGVQRGRRGGQNRGPRQPVPVQADTPPPYTRPTPTRRASSPTPAGYVHNRGADYIPFTITDHHGRPTLARFVQVHMTDNPYVIARLTASGADYRGEIHAAPVNDVDTPPEHLTDAALRMFARTFPALDRVNEAIGRIGDRSLEAEVRRHQGISIHMEVNEEKRVRLERERQQLELEMGMCVHRLQEARACNRILDEMVSDQRINHHFTGWHNERGCSG